MERKSRKNFLGADDADDADLFSLSTDYQLSKIIIAQQHQRHLRLKNHPEEPSLPSSPVPSPVPGSCVLLHAEVAAS